MSVPPEFFSDQPLQPTALADRYGLSPVQLSALEALRLFRADWMDLTQQSFGSADRAAAAVYTLLERVYERTPALREQLELGGQIYRNSNAQWRVSLPNLGPSDASIGTGSRINTAAPIGDDSFFWHTHPSSLPGSGHGAGFSFADLTGALRAGRGMFVYQNGRPYRMDIGDAWRQMSPQQRDSTGRRMLALATAVRSSQNSPQDRAAALNELRALLRDDIVRVTVFQRSGINPTARPGEPVQVMPVSLWVDDEGTMQLLPNRQPPLPLGSLPQ